MHTIPLTSACFFCLKATNLAAQFEKTLTACIISHPQLSLVPFQTDQATSIVGERSGFFSFHGIRSSSVLCPQQWQQCQGPTTGRTEIGNAVVPLPVFVSKTLFHIPLTSPSLPRPAALVSFVGWLASAETAGGLGRRVERGNQELGLGHGK